MRKVPELLDEAPPHRRRVRRRNPLRRNVAIRLSSSIVLGLAWFVGRDAGLAKSKPIKCCWLQPIWAGKGGNRMEIMNSSNSYKVRVYFRLRSVKRQRSFSRGSSVAG